MSRRYVLRLINSSNTRLDEIIDSSDTVGIQTLQPWHFLKDALNSVEEVIESFEGLKIGVFSLDSIGAAEQESRLRGLYHP